MSPAINRAALEELYARYNRREFAHPDPVEMLYRYDDVGDREIAALVASHLAYGRVAQILKSVRAVLERMPCPAAFVRRSSRESLTRTLAGFKHRFTTGEALAALLCAAGRVAERHGWLGGCFADGLEDEHETVLPALTAFVAEIEAAAGRRLDHLLPSPSHGSACKRLNLFLRWMVRRDEVDPGGWDHVSPARLIVPLDTHMLRISRMLGLTQRKQADLSAALEVTTAFRAVAPEDPVRYDFALTRLGIRRDADPGEFVKSLTSGSKSGCPK